MQWLHSEYGTQILAIPEASTVLDFDVGVSGLPATPRYLY